MTFFQKAQVVGKTLMVVVILLFCSLTLYNYNSIALKAQETIAEFEIKKPDFEHESNQTFLDAVNKCVDYVYYSTTDVFPVNRMLLVSQAALESGWGTSRFARVGKNLFGMRTYDLQEPHMLPSNKPRKWGVKVYDHECDSVLHYIQTLNNGTAFGEYQKIRDEEGIDDAVKLLYTLDAYASDKNYFPKIKSIMEKINTEYKMNYIK